MRQNDRDRQARKARSSQKKQKRDFSKERKSSEKEKRNMIQKQEEKMYDDMIYGRNSVLELLKSNQDINKIFVERGEKIGSIKEIIAKAKEAKVITIEIEKSKLDAMTTENHQGVIASIPPFNYCEVEDILELAKERKEEPFIVILDGIEDPHNLGAIIRTAETAGVHGIIIPKRRSAFVNSTVSKVASGATAYMKVARVNNLKDAIKKLKEAGLWIIGTAGEAQNIF